MYRRAPAVSGIFYPSSGGELTLTVQRYLVSRSTSRAFGIVSPHAGYIYSGPVEGAIYSAVDIPPSVLLLGPNHRLSTFELYGKALLFSSGCFVTPLGEVSIDEDLAGLLLSGGAMIVADASSHKLEHSLEVQLPFLQVLRSDVKIVPMLMNLGWSEDPRQLHDACKSLGEIIAAAIRAHTQDVLIVASSDMNHREPREVTERKDRRALERIEAFDVAGFLEVTDRENITVCGKVAIATMLEAARGLGATEAQVVMYGDSGDASGDIHDVVGYAGILVR
jgi:AmmeMemoRadiSam system protein B